MWQKENRIQIQVSELCSVYVSENFAATFLLALLLLLYHHANGRPWGNKVADRCLMTAQLTAAGGYVAVYDVCLTHLSVFLARSLSISVIVNWRNWIKLFYLYHNLKNSLDDIYMYIGYDILHTHTYIFDKNIVYDIGCNVRYGVYGIRFSIIVCSKKYILSFCCMIVANYEYR